MFKSLILISVFLVSCTSEINQNYDLERAVFEDTYKELFPWLKQLPDSYSFNPQTLSQKDSVDYPWLYGQLKVWLESDPSLSEVFFGVVMLDSVYSADFFIQETPYLSDISIYPESLISDSDWITLVKGFSSRKLKSVSLDKFKLTYLGNLKTFKQSDHSKDRSITTNYAIPAWYLRFSRVSFSPNKTKAVFYAEDNYTHGGLVFAKFINSKWEVVHYEINWVG